MVWIGKQCWQQWIGDNDKIECYDGNLLLPVFWRKKTVLSSAQVLSLLSNIGQSDRTVSSALICDHQPLRVEHQTFIVDFQALKSKDDVKCDDAGSWKNNSSSKFSFAHDGDTSTQITSRKAGSNGDCVLKRENFFLRDGNENDFRKRIDTINCKYNKLISDVLICPHIWRMASARNVNLTNCIVSLLEDITCSQIFEIIALWRTSLLCSHFM